MFEETLYQSAAGGKPFVDVLKEQGIIPGIKVDTGLQASSEHMMIYQSQLWRIAIMQINNAWQSSCRARHLRCLTLWTYSAHNKI